jgi:hypothetical protein
MFATLHAAAPPVGFSDVTTLPPSSPATHTEADGHDTLTRLLPFSWDSGVTVHAGAPPVGSVEAATNDSPTATHKLGDAQEIAVRAEPC